MKIRILTEQEAIKQDKIFLKAIRITAPKRKIAPAPHKKQTQKQKQKQKMEQNKTSNKKKRAKII